MKQKKQKKGSTIIMIIKIQSVVPTSITIFIAIIFLFSHSIVTPLSFAQSDMSNSTNQTMKNMSQSANQTVEHLQQDANQTSEEIQGNAGNDVSNITEKAKNIGKNLTEVAKKLGETINKKMNDLAK
jgi:predicted PurR-regulated permease PerM